MAAFGIWILVDRLNVYISHCFKYIGTIKPDGGQHKTLNSNLFRTNKKLALSEGGAWGGLTGDYCISLVSMDSWSLQQQG